MKGRHVYSAEVDYFNSGDKVDSHEKGHILGLDHPKKDNIENVMSYSSDGKGFNVDFRQKWDIIDALIYNLALQMKGYGYGHTDTQKILYDFLKENVEEF